jgi:DNA polymerase III gamma/tau subunit
VLGISGKSALESFYKYLKSNDTKGALTEIQNLYSQGLDLVQFTKDFLEHLRMEMLKSTENNNMAEVQYALRTAETFQEAYMKLKTSTIPQLPLEIAAIKSTEGAITFQPQATPEKQKAETSPVQPEQTIQPERTHQPIKQNISEQERETPTDKIPLTISYAKENWARVIELIQTPFVRMSFKAGKPVKVENSVVTIEFSSNFHKDKVDKTEAKLEIEKAIATIFDEPGQVAYTVAEINLSTQTEPVPVESRPVKVPDEEPNQTDIALEVFGGKLIEN